MQRLLLARFVHWSLGSFALTLAFLITAPWASAEDTVDLTGAVPKPGTVIRTQVAFKIEPGEFDAKASTGKQTGIVRMEAERIEETTILKPSQREKYRYELNIIKDNSTYDFVFSGEPLFRDAGKVTFNDPLEGRKIRFTYTDDKWKRSLQKADPPEGQHGRFVLQGEKEQGKNPDKEQQKKIQVRSIWELGEDFYPEDPVAVGYEWSTDGAPLLRIMFGENWLEEAGEATLKFEKLTEYRGEQAAELLINAELKGRGLDNGNNELDYTIRVTGTIIRSIDSNMDREINLEGDVEMESVVVRNDVPVDVVIAGPFSIQYLVRIK